MDYEPIKKVEANRMPVRPNLFNYEKAWEDFRWEDINRELDGFEDGGLNIAYEAVDRYMGTPLREKTALFWEGKDGESREYTFHDLYRLTNRFADALIRLGIRKGDRIFTYADRIPEAEK